VSTISGSLLTSLWGTGTSSSSTVSSTSADLLISYYNNKAGVTGTASGSTGLSEAATATQANKAAPTGTTKAPTAPWLSDTSTSALLKSVMSGGAFIKESAISLDVKGASQDYKKLYTFYQGVSALNALTARSQEAGVSATEQAQIQRRFAAGMKEVQAYLQSADLDHLNLIEGALTESLKNTVDIASTNTKYTGLTVHAGSSTEAVPEFAGDVKFSMSVKRTGKADPIVVDIDLSEMGSATRSMSNVTTFINDKLKDAGLSTKFQVNRTAGVPTTVTIGTKTVATSTGKDTFSFGIKGDSTETLTFTPAASATSLYVVQTTGKETTSSKMVDGKLTKTTTDTYAKQLLKFQTDVSDTATAPEAASQPYGTSYWTSGQAVQAGLEDSISTVRSSVASPDGGVYVLADVTGPVDEQTLKGTQDVALIKYDSTGQVVFTRTLGAASSASGYALAVSADGHVAVTGSVTGSLTSSSDPKVTTNTDGTTAVNYTNTTTSGTDATLSDSFVTLYDASGNEQWTKRTAATKEDEALSVAFGADNSVIIGGRTKSVMPGANTTQAGGWDAYVMGFDANGKATFTTQTGTAQTDSTQAMTVDGTDLYVVTNQNGEAVLSKYDLSSGKPSLTSSRNLGGLGGGSVSDVSVYGGKVYVGGVSGNGNMLSGGTNTATYSGGTDAFAISVGTDLNDTSADKIAYFGGTGNETAKVTFSEGKAWIAGQSDGEITGTDKVGTKDGYVARMNIDTGALEWQQRFTGKDSVVDPNAIAVSKGSSSVLDKLGLPTGTLLYKDSTTLVANSSVRAGDQFYIRDPKSGAKKTITIDAKDTLETLATKITRASGYNLKVTVSKANGESHLTMAPSQKTSAMELIKGPSGKDALESLGISDGLVKNVLSNDELAKQNQQKIKKDVGLRFDTNISLDTEASRTAAQTALEGVMSNIKSAYNWLRFGSTSTDDKKSTTAGTVPAYITNQLSNYQAALQRLTGGA
jgi:hypothetical protein